MISGPKFAENSWLFTKYKVDTKNPRVTRGIPYLLLIMEFSDFILPTHPLHICYSVAIINYRVTGVEEVLGEPLASPSPFVQKIWHLTAIFSAQNHYSLLCLSYHLLTGSQCIRRMSFFLRLLFDLIMIWALTPS